MAERKLSIRQSVVDGGKVKAELSEIGEQGGALAQENRGGSLPQQIRPHRDDALESGAQETSQPSMMSPGYPVNAESVVRRVKPSVIDCATSSRSKGSRCNGGSAPAAITCLPLMPNSW